MLRKGQKPSQTFAYAALAGFAAMVVALIILQSFFSTTTVIAARTTILAGSKVTAAMIENIDVPSSTLGKNILRKPDEVIGKTVSTTRMPGDYLSPNCFRSGTTRKGGANSIETDKYVFLIPISNASAFAGFLRPGAKINIIAIPSQASQDTFKSQTILANVEVIKTTYNTQRGGLKDMQGVLVKVTKIESERLAEALDTGSISIAVAGHVND